MTKDYSPSGPDRLALVKELRALKRKSGRNKHDQAITLISAGIGEGLNTRKLIVDVVSEAGLNPDHVAIILNDQTGDDPVKNHWRIDSEGNYACHTD